MQILAFFLIGCVAPKHAASFGEAQLAADYNTLDETGNPIPPVHPQSVRRLLRRLVRSILMPALDDKNAYCEEIKPGNEAAKKEIYNKYKYLAALQNALAECAKDAYDCYPFADAFVLQKNIGSLDATVCTGPATKYATYLFCKACYTKDMSGPQHVGFRNGCKASKAAKGASFGRTPAQFEAWFSPCAAALDKSQKLQKLGFPKGTKFDWGQFAA
jgi:hypothetical protein